MICKRDWISAIFSGALTPAVAEHPPQRENGQEQGDASEADTAIIVQPDAVGPESVGRGQKDESGKGQQNVFDRHKMNIPAIRRPSASLRLALHRATGVPGQNRRETRTQLV